MSAAAVIDIRLARHGSLEYLRAVELREQVLRRPLGRGFTAAELATEAEQFHLILCRDGELAACAVLQRVMPGIARMRQVAVKTGLQGHGLGRVLVKHFEALAFSLEAREIKLHARQTAVPFYLRLGYEVAGPRFEEIGLPHLPMRKVLPAKIVGPEEGP